MNDALFNRTFTFPLRDANKNHIIYDHIFADDTIPYYHFEGVFQNIT